MGHEIGLTGLDLKEFIKEQQNLAREEREKEHEYQREKDERDRQYELERQKEITKQMEVEAELKKTLHQEQDGSHHVMTMIAIVRARRVQLRVIKAIR